MHVVSGRVEIAVAEDGLAKEEIATGSTCKPGCKRMTGAMGGFVGIDRSLVGLPEQVRVRVFRESIKEQVVRWVRAALGLGLGCALGIEATGDGVEDLFLQYRYGPTALLIHAPSSLERFPIHFAFHIPSPVRISYLRGNRNEPEACESIFLHRLPEGPIRWFALKNVRERKRKTFREPKAGADRDAEEIRGKHRRV